MNIKQQDIEKLDNLFHEILFLNQKYKLPDNMSVLLKMAPLDSKILNILFEHTEMTIQEMNNLLSLPNSTLTSSIKRLESNGFVERTINKKDMRSYLVKLTIAGTELQNLHKKYEYELFKKLLACLDSNEEVESFLSLLGKIVEKIREGI